MSDARRKGTRERGRRTQSHHNAYFAAALALPNILIRHLIQFTCSGGALFIFGLRNTLRSSAFSCGVGGLFKPALRYELLGGGSENMMMWMGEMNLVLKVPIIIACIGVSHPEYYHRILVSYYTHIL